MANVDEHKDIPAESTASSPNEQSSSLEKHETANSATDEVVQPLAKLGFFDRWLAIWVLLAIILGVILGKYTPTGEALRKGEFVGTLLAERVLVVLG
jgi:ACR3 family arsenite transporter